MLADGLTVSYTIGAGITGVTTTLQTSANLESWEDFAGQVDTVGNTVTATLTAAARGFVRLKAE